VAGKASNKRTRRAWLRAQQGSHALFNFMPHRLTDINEISRTAVCSVCGVARIQTRCRYKDGRINWRCMIAGTQRPSSKRKQQYKYQYRSKVLSTSAEYEAKLAEQKNGCAICHGPASGKRLAADHCHVTGKTRGLLCQHCNMGLGHFKDNLDLLQSAIGYLRAYTTH
jgi:hypothetical protein